MTSLGSAVAGVSPSEIQRRARWLTTDLAILISVVAGTVTVLMRDSLLPAKFSYDSDKIQAMAQGTLAYDDRSFTAISNVYRWAGLADQPTLAALVGLFGFVAVAVALRARLAAWTPGRSTPYLFGISIMLAAIYLGVYSKDVLVVPIVAVCVLWRKARGGTVVLLAVALLYGSLFRSYWLVIACVAAALIVVLRRARSLVLVGLAAVGLVVALGIAYSATSGQPATALRAAINDGRADREDAMTLIPVFFGGSGIVDQSVNLVITLAVLVVPVPLVLLGSAYHVFVAALLLSIWLVLGLALHRGAGSGAFRDDQVLRRGAALVVAMLITQAIFEPDYGSALRHIVPFLLIAILLTVRLGGPTADAGVPRELTVAGAT